MLRLITLAALVAAMGPLTVPHAEAQNMRFGHPISAESTWGQGAEAFKRLLEEGSDGAIQVEVFHNAALGSNREILEMATLGTIEFVLVGAAHTSRYVPQANAVTLPYLWKDGETMFAALDGALERHYNALYEAEGLVLLGWWDNGFRHVTNNTRPIMTVEDFRGIRLRTLPSRPQIEFFRKVGSAPTPMDWVEVVPALRTGTIDGQENPPPIVSAARLFEVQKYYSLTSHMNEPAVLLMSKPVYDRLSPELQLAVTVAGRRATLEQRRINQEAEGRILEELRGQMEVNEVPEATLAELRQIAQEVYPAVMDDLGPGAETLVRQLILLNR
jgi:TRAP-type transport system periplasmic protein